MSKKARVKEVEVQPVHLKLDRPLARFVVRFAFAAILLLSLPSILSAESRGKVFSMKGLTGARSNQLTKSLQRITGWKNLGFDEQGTLTFGGESKSGSALARDLLNQAVTGEGYFALEDASRRADVVFCKIVPGRWMKGNSEVPINIILIDFADFDQVIGDESALEAFNVGWGVLHEMVHGLKNLDDTDKQDQLGDCEKLINQMRKECGLAERAEYFYKMHPATTDTEYARRYVRMPFEQWIPSTNKKKRYWIVWDANIVGGQK
jgi:hypothetical protein